LLTDSSATLLEQCYRWGNRDFVEKLKGMKIKGSAKDQPSYRIVQSIDA